MDEFLLRTDQLTVGYDGKPLIRDLEITLKKGEILTLIGPNGAGKSTILKTLSRQLEKISGKIYIAGKELSEYSGNELARKQSLVLTERLRTELMSCREVVESGRYPYTGRLGLLEEEDRRKVDEAMALAHVEELSDRDFMHISDGQRQRIMLARAISQDPEIIILDEPTSFLDVRYQMQCLEILRTLAKKKNIAVLCSLHELALAQKISDKVLCIKDRKVAHYGPVEEIFTAPLIEDLYDLGDISFDPAFGNVELAPPEGEPKVFVLAGGGEGLPVYRRLEKESRPFATGVLHENDIDCHLAELLAKAVVTEEAFEPISSPKIEEAKALMDEAELVIDALPPLKEQNRGNGELLQYAEEKQIPILKKAEFLK